MQMPPVRCVQKFSLERASTADPRELLRSITEHGIRQEFCINDLGEPCGDDTAAQRCSILRRAKSGLTVLSRGT